MKKFIVTLLLSLIIGAACSVIMISYKAHKASSPESIAAIQESMSNKLLRFHVIANSNSLEDQELKLEVKKAVTDYLYDILKSSSSLEESKTLVNTYNSQVIKIAKNVISEKGYDYSVSGQIVDNAYFPLKTYGDIMLPQGNYCAYEIIIGDGGGANWWCILYPPLCFIDISTGVVPDSSKEQLSALLDEDEYSLITTGKPKNVTVRFKYLKFLNKFLE